MRIAYSPQLRLDSIPVEKVEQGWRQHDQLLKKVKKLDRQINCVAAKKGPRYTTRMKPLYRELLQKIAFIAQRAHELCLVTSQPQPSLIDTFGANTLQAFIVRTQRVAERQRNEAMS